MLAADTAVFRGSSRVGKTRKIAQRDDGAMVGVAGSGPHAQAFIKWFLAGEIGDAPDMGDKDDNCGALIVRPDGRVEERTRFGVCEELAEFTALGCGADFALAAMMAGANAERAVEITIALECYTGGEIDVLRLPLRAVGVA